MPPTRVKVIDVHSHWYPPEWLELVEKEAVDNGATKIERNARGFMVISIPGLGVTFQPQYTDIPSRLKAMDEKGVAIHVMSLTQPMVYWAKPEFGLRLSQAFNNACSELHKRYPERFLGLAMLPMQSPDMSVAELDRVSKLPGIKGAYMSTHVLGKNLDDKSFWPVYEKCEALGFPIFLHPTNTLGADRMRNYYLRNFIGNPVESAIAASSLMFSGVMDKYPKLDVVLPQGSMLNPRYPAAVVAGNVETSQYVTDTLYAALGALAGSQGTMGPGAAARSRAELRPAARCGACRRGRGPGCRWRCCRRRREDLLRRDSRRRSGRQEDPDHQGGSRIDEPWAEGSEGSCRCNSCNSHREGKQGDCRQGEGCSRSCWRKGKHQVVLLVKKPHLRMGLFYFFLFKSKNNFEPA